MIRINPALTDLEPLVGDWTMELHGAAFLPDPDTRLTGSVAIAWTEDGAALVIRQNDAPHPPAATWIIGRDDADSDYSVLYADDRGVSRSYRMSFAGSTWRMWRETPGFTQRFQAYVSADHDAIVGRWEKSADRGASWEHDFNIDYTRKAGSTRLDRAARARALYEAFSARDRPFVDGVLSEDFRFSSPIDIGLDRAGYFERCWPGSGQGQTFEFVRLIESGDEVLVTYEMTTPDGGRGRNTEVLTFKGDQICAAEVYFGWNL
ncbi:MAG TPA: nuclear transport factor 2 family protein [Solirubrobacteraceae bacterium]|nr:nuclear transport factor 2 family protein [Solirubrobacteraceae bacterium]